MRATIGLLALVTAIALVGCGEKPVEADAALTAPLSVEQWKGLPVETKYEVSTLERVKDGDPKFQQQREWDKFLRTVVNPARKKEAPNGMRR